MPSGRYMFISLLMMKSQNGPTKNLSNEKLHKIGDRVFRKKCQRERTSMSETNQGELRENAGDQKFRRTKHNQLTSSELLSNN